MTNLHNPERMEGESFAAYKARRAASNKANRDAMSNPRGLVGSRERYRDDMSKSGAMGKRIRVSDALMAAWAAKRVPSWNGDRDKDGKPITLVGRNPDGSRRIWLAGISSQRGY